MTILDASGWQTLPRAAAGWHFVIGDIHGQLDLMTGAFALVADRVADREGRGEPELVLLGDLIDRGPHPLACLDRAARGLGGVPTVCLAGNHEQMLLQSLDGDADAQRVWLRNGGATLLAEGLSEAELGRVAARQPDAGRDWAVWLRAILGEERLGFLRTLRPWYRSGDVISVHAGLCPWLSLEENLAQPVRPTVPIRALEEDRSIYWVREPFLAHEGPYPGDLFVVHGHTPHSRLEVVGNRVCLDLGSFATGRVGVAEIDYDRMRLFTVSR